MPLIIAVLMAAVLTACGNKEATESQKGETNEYVYVPEFYTLDVGEETYINNLKIYGENLYYTSYTHDESAQEMINEFVRRPLQDLENPEIINLYGDVPEGFTSALPPSALSGSRLSALGVCVSMETNCV